MMKKLLILLLALLSHILIAQPYTLTRGLPVAEIAGSGTAITNLGSNNSVGPFNIGFSFPFFENTYSQFYLSSNGYISFESGNATLLTSIPSTSHPNNIIAFAATSWNATQGTPIINYFTTGTAPNRILIINFKDVKNSFTGSLGSLQVQLHETSGKIEIHYPSLLSYSKTTIGIENATGDIGITNNQLNNRDGLVISNETIRFEKINPCSGSVTVSTSSNILCHGTSTLTANASSIGTFQWFKNSIAIAGATNSTYQANTPGVYSVRFVGDGGCLIQSNDTEIVATINPTISHSYAYICNQILSSGVPSGNYTYQWFKNDSIINGQTGFAIIPQSAGNYRVEVSSGNCKTTSSESRINANSVTITKNTPNICNSIYLGLNLTTKPANITYAWTGPNGFSSTEINPIITKATSSNEGIYSVTVNFGCGDTQTATTQVNVNPNTLEVNPAISGNLCGSLNQNINYSYTPFNTYSWVGPNGFSSNTSNLFIDNLKNTHAGIYTLTVNFGCGDIKTATTNLTVKPNNLSLQPSFSTNVCGSLNLYSDASYTPNRTYSWTAPDGFHSTSIYPVINNVSNSKTGIYTLSVDFGCGDVQTATTNVTLTPNTIDLNASVSVNTCGTTTLYAFTSGANSKTFNWAGPNGFSSTTSTATISNATASNAGIYTVTVGFGCGDIKTATTSLSVTPNTISINPTVSTNMCGTAALSVSTSNNTSKTYLWKGPNGFSSTEASPLINNVTNAHAGIYTVTVNFGCGDTQTATTNLTVTPNTISLSNTQQARICTPVTLFSSGSSTSSMTYLWQGPNGFSSTQRNPTLSNITQNEAGIYTLTVNFGCGDTQTATTNLVVNKNSLTINPSISANLCGGVYVGASADNTETRAYSWTGPNGFTSTLNYTYIPQVTAGYAGIYSVTVNFGCGDIQTATTNLTVTSNTISIPSARDFNLCGTINLSSTTTTTASRTYTWTGPNGFKSTQENASIHNASAANAGIYTLTVDFGCGDIQTVTTALTVIPNRLEISPSFSVNNCKTVSLFSTSTYTQGKTYSWTGPNGFSSSSSTPSISNATEADEGVYTLTVDFGCGDTKIATTYVSVNPNTVNISSNYTTTVCSSATLSVYGSAPIQSYNWAGPNGFTSTSSNATIYPVTPEIAGIYTVTVNFGCGDIQTATTNVTVTTNSLSLASTYNSNICSAVSLSPAVSNTPSRSFLWKGPNGFSSTSSNLYIPNFTTSNAGTYTLTVDFGCGETLTASTKIEAIPNAIYLPSTANVNLCGQLSLFPSVSNTSTSTYSWQGPNGFSSNRSYIEIDNFTSAKAGIYTLTVNFGCGDVQTSTTKVAIVANKLSIDSTFTAALCNNLTLSADASYTLASTYTWAGPNGFSSTSKVPTIYKISNDNVGIYTLTVNFGCGETLTATTRVNIKPNTLILNPTTTASRCGTVSLNAYSSSTSSKIYNWKGPNGFTSNEANPIIHNVNNTHEGIYTLTINFGCGDIQTATTNVEIVQIPLIIANSSGNPNCPGRTVDLGVTWQTDNTLAASVNWIGPGGFSSSKSNTSILLTSNSAGTYSITVDFGMCGISTATTAIFMGTPQFSAYSSNPTQTLCESNSIELYTMLNNSSTDDIEGSTMAHYTWRGPDNFNSNERNPRINNLTTAKAGIYTVTVDLANGCKGSYTSNVAVNVTKNPELQTDYYSTFNCSGDSAKLISRTVNILGNTSVSYLWTGPDNFSSNESSPTINNIGTGGIYTLTATFTGGCIGTYSSTVPVYSSAKPKLQLEANKEACVGRPFSLALTNFIGNDNLIFSWTGPNNFKTNMQFPYFISVSKELAGIYTLTVTDTSGNCPEVFTASTLLTVKDVCTDCSLRISNTSTVDNCPGNTIYLSASLSIDPSTAYSWVGPDGFSSTSQTLKLINVNSSGTYTVTATSSDCVGVYTATTFVNVNSNPNSPNLVFSVNNNLCEGNYLHLDVEITNGYLVESKITGPNDYAYYGPFPYQYKSWGGDGYIQNVNPNMNGVYTVNATFKKYCSDSVFKQSASVNVIIPPKPAPPTITGTPEAITIGEVANLSANACSAGNTLQWFNSSSDNSLSIRPTNTANYWAICRSESCHSNPSNLVKIAVDNCPKQFILTNPEQNYNSGYVVRKTKTDTGNITATNLITGTARVSYQAKSIILNAGFKAENGTVFKAETGGCD